MIICIDGVLMLTNSRKLNNEKLQKEIKDSGSVRIMINLRMQLTPWKVSIEKLAGGAAVM